MRCRHCRRLLLKEKDLMLAAIIMHYHNCETLQRHHRSGTRHHHCSTHAIPGKIKDLFKLQETMAQSRQPAYNQLCAHCQKVRHFTKVCGSRKTQQPLPITKPGANAIHTDYEHAVQLFPLTQHLTEPALK